MITFPTCEVFFQNRDETVPLIPFDSIAYLSPFFSYTLLLYGGYFLTVNLLIKLSLSNLAAKISCRSRMTKAIIHAQFC